jgi:glycosyltransferase involved in cell wall biosynthesis
MLISTSREKLVSVILPVYNAEKYVSASIESVLKQTYRDFELLIINDGSTDGTQSQLNKYRKYPKVKIIERENKGLVATLNEAVNRSEGKYIMRMDADDISLPERMEKQLTFLKGSQLDIVGSAIKTFGKFFNYKRVYFEEDNKLKFQLLFASCFAHPTILCKKEVLTNNLYSGEFEKIEDYELWTRLAMGPYKMGNHNESLLRYRVHKKQITTGNRRYQDQKRIEIAKRYCKHYFSSELFSEAIEILLCRDFSCLDTEKAKTLNRYYDFLVKDFSRYTDIINYHFFLCYMHNYFSVDRNKGFFDEIPFLKKSILLAFNKNQSLKKLPVKAYRKLL